MSYKLLFLLFPYTHFTIHHAKSISLEFFIVVVVMFVDYVYSAFCSILFYCFIHADRTYLLSLCLVMQTMIYITITFRGKEEWETSFRESDITTG